MSKECRPKECKYHKDLVKRIGLLEKQMKRLLDEQKNKQKKTIDTPDLYDYDYLTE